MQFSTKMGSSKFAFQHQYFFICQKKMNLKNIHIGQLIHKRVTELSTDPIRISNFMNCTEIEITKMYNSESLDTKTLLKWSKLLEYDFFRIYVQHLILFAPQTKNQDNKTSLPVFRKNIYTIEVIDFILERMECGDMTKNEIIDQYKIPKTTLFKWIEKYKK